MKQNYKETRQASEAKPAHVESRTHDGGLTGGMMILLQERRQRRVRASRQGRSRTMWYTDEKNSLTHPGHLPLPTITQTPNTSLTPWPWKTPSCFYLIIAYLRVKRLNLITSENPDKEGSLVQWLWASAMSSNWLVTNLDFRNNSVGDCEWLTSSCYTSVSIPEKGSNNSSTSKHLGKIIEIIYILCAHFRSLSWW